MYSQVQRVSVFVMVVFFLSACVTTRPPTPAPGAVPPVAKGAVEVPPMDLAPVAGHAIALDPGHGGPWPGAVADTNGLREADLNLRVALTVRTLLEKAGATVVMTRMDDAVPVPGSMSDDLAARAALARKAGAEILVSIHHNASGDPLNSRDDLEVYYKFRDDALSLSLGESLMWELARRARSDAEVKSLLPGNFKVLREAALPAVLLESYYLSDPASAKFLATDDGVRTESQAIAAGIAQYFAQDPPCLKTISATLDSANRGATVDVTYLGKSPIVPASVTVLIDGAAVEGVAAGGAGQLKWVTSTPLPNGDLKGLVVGRNGTGVSFRWPFSLRVMRAPASVAASLTSAALQPDAEACVEVRVLDAYGLPVADGTEVTATVHGLTSSTRDGVARLYTKAQAGEVRVRAGNVEASVRVETKADGLRSVRVTSAAGSPVSARLTGADSRVQAVTTPEGWAAVSADVRAVHVEAAGYVESDARLTGSTTTISLTPLEDGALLGRKIAIDPNFGGRSFGAVGPTGLRACDVNLDVARAVSERLRAAGASVTLVRDGDEDMTELQRVARAEDVSAELYVGISYGAPARENAPRDERSSGAFVRHYWNSEKGKRLAGLVATVLGGLTTGASGAYPIAQTSGVAVIVQPGHIGDAQTEDRMRRFEEVQRVADRVYSGLLAYFSKDAAKTR